MQAVPSLVGTGTAATVAAIGLVFGQPPEPQPPFPNSIPHRFPADDDRFRSRPLPPRPSTSAVHSYFPDPSPVEDFPYGSFRQFSNAAPGPLTSHPTGPPSAQRPLTGVSVSSPRSHGRRHSFIRRSTIDTKTGSRYAPDPGAAPHDQTYTPVSPLSERMFAPHDAHQHPRTQQDPDMKPVDLPRTRRRNSSTPLPTLNRLSSFNVDVATIGSSAASTAPSRPLHSPINYSQASSATTHSRGPSGERSVTLAGSDVEVRDGGYGDDEYTDFKSDAMYDCFLTGASSNRVRSVETPLESMFDDSPHSAMSNGRTKRLSIQEMLGPSWDGETRITEEDESVPTPIRSAHLAATPELGQQGQIEGDFGFDSTQGMSLVNRDFERLSFDDDDDYDWAREDENALSNHLSPPSSTNSRRVSPTLRQALRNINGNNVLDPQQDSMSDRPRSNIFDWSEPSVPDRYDTDMPRPKTVHGKQELDLRGGRSASRKPPGAAHIRSQSVPVVADPTDGSKPPPKFGTWGLSAKTASEDWDDDFEFEGEEPSVLSPGGKDSATSFSVVVPASIQATQPSVRAHSGQIRELSLLVNDLKRLCRHGKDLDILRGPLASKWAEAESIIALASPDEDEDEEYASTRPSVDFDRSKIDDRFLDEGFDGPVLDNADDPFTIPEPEMSKTAVIRERNSVRRRSVFSPEDDIFGNWPLAEGTTTISRPQLVKRAGQLRDALSDAVRRAELLTQSPAGTPRRGAGG
ncbi:hypothetical protein N0V88_005366 [Collariella sp. IMI 366227]|nr:hypothetical protein N0V88_005366 [Collariella sp. IMI 366227]